MPSFEKSCILIKIARHQSIELIRKHPALIAVYDFMIKIFALCAHTLTSFPNLWAQKSVCLILLKRERFLTHRYLSSTGGIKSASRHVPMLLKMDTFMQIHVFARHVYRYAHASTFSLELIRINTSSPHVASNCDNHHLFHDINLKGINFPSNNQFPVDHLQ